MDLSIVSNDVVVEAQLNQEEEAKRQKVSKSRAGLQVMRFLSQSRLIVCSRQTKISTSLLRCLTSCEVISDY
jgi:hypothetical protein